MLRDQYSTCSWAPLKVGTERVRRRQTFLLGSPARKEWHGDFVLIMKVRSFVGLFLTSSHNLN